MKPITLDAVDIRILSAVQAHGPLSKSRLAEMVHLSPTPCLTRLNRLKQAGLIHGYHADIALAQLGDFARVVVTVSLAQHRRSDFDRFEAHIQSLDAVVECIATGGGMDYVLNVICPSMAAFQNLMDDMLAAELGIDRYMTYIVTREVKSAHPNLAALTAGGET